MRTHTTLAAWMLVLASAVAVAQPPDRLDSYRVLPRFSSLTESGGFAGMRREYNLIGDYGFAQEWSGGRPGQPLELTPRFVDPDLRAPLGPMLPAFIDVGHLLNLENLAGELLPQPLAFTPFEVFRFEGIANDSPAGSPLEQSLVEIYAVTLGPWMYLHGETTPRPWSADVFEYELRALARRGDSTDWNADGVVDAADYTALRDEAARLAEAGDDYLTEGLAAWRDSFGQRAPEVEAFQAAIQTALAQQAAAVPTPEPTALVLVVLAVTPCLRSRPCGCRP